jgi:hypothetical protein
MTIKKSLIILDSNQTRNLINGGIRYDCFNFGEKFQNFQEKNIETGIQDYIDIAIPELVLDELLDQKLFQYKSDYKHLPRMVERIKLLPDTKVEGIELPAENFDCLNYLKPLIEDFLTKNKIDIMKIKEELKSSLFDRLLQRAKEGTNPFKGKILGIDVKSKNTDAGFKDAVIWETILQYEGIKNYSHVYFISNDEGFKVKEEFIEKYPEINFQILNKIEGLFEDYLDGFYKMEKLKEFILTEDFKLIFKKYFTEELGWDMQDDLRIVEDSIRIEECFFKDLEEMYIEDLYKGDLEKIKIINFKFLLGEDEQLAEIFWHEKEKEIIAGRGDVA